MKKILTVLVALAFLALSSASFAGEKRVANNISAKSFAAFDPSYEQAFACSSLSSVPCSDPVKFIDSTVENTVLHITFYAPATQGYVTHYIVSDFAGTFAYYNFSDRRVFNGPPDAFNTFELEVSTLLPGDYTFTSISVGDDGVAAISDPYKFHVE